jgi:glutaredoxin-like protein
MIMAFMKESDRKAIRAEFQALKQPVKLVLFVSDSACEYCTQTKQLLEEIAGLSPKLTLQVHDLHDVQRAEEFRVDKAPAIVVMNGKDYGIRYFGIPSGYEFGSFIKDILDVSRGESGLRADTKAALAKVAEPIRFQVFVTPTCPYCPRAVRMAHRMAMENELIRADMVEAMEFPELSERYGVMAVPRVVINEDHYFEGALSEPEFLGAALQAIGARTESPERV